jgi:hypothetical protein
MRVFVTGASGCGKRTTTLPELVAPIVRIAAVHGAICHGLDKVTGPRTSVASFAPCEVQRNSSSLVDEPRLSTMKA